MSAYKRFVSYLYEYDHRKKGKNRGFVRVEVRNHQCCLELHMTLPACPFIPVFRAYAFVARPGALHGLFLGNPSWKQSNVYGQFRLQTPVSATAAGILMISTVSSLSAKPDNVTPLAGVTVRFHRKISFCRNPRRFFGQPRWNNRNPRRQTLSAHTRIQSPHRTPSVLPPPRLPVHRLPHFPGNG